jgi:hypothetical protein
MVLDRLIDFTYVPLADDGFRRISTEISSWAFSASFDGSNDTFPTLVWMIPVLSTLKSILPAFTSVTALPTSAVTVPDLGFGISPRGPRIRPSRPTFAMTFGMVMMTSTSVQPCSILAI